MQRGLPNWINARNVALLWAAMLVYGSLLPFHFHLATMWEQAEGPADWLLGILTAPRWHWPSDATHLGVVPSASLVDLAANLLLYGPLGIALRLDIIRGKRSPAGQLLIIALVLGFISYLIECTQGLTLTRVPSLFDVVSNTAGGVIAACFAVPIAGRFAMLAGRAYTAGAVSLARLRWARPVVAGAAVVTAGTLLNVLSHTVGTGEGGWADSLPFARFQSLPYDVAFLRLAGLLAGYLLLAFALAFALAGAPVRRRVTWLFSAQIAFAVARLIMSWLGGAGVPDFAEPVVAVLAAAALIVIARIAADAAHRPTARVPA